jgi:lipopolysaccharide/colanic/teichoic acid biosynthesis glycosyltransferase
MAVALAFATYVRRVVPMEPGQQLLLLLYFSVSSSAAVLMFYNSRIYDVIPRYFGRHEAQRMILILMGSIGLGCLSAFIVNRLVTIPRGSIIIHGLLSFCLMFAVRSAMQLRASRVSRRAHWDDVMNVVVVGINPVAALYIDTVGVLGAPTVRVVGVLAEDSKVSARWIRGQRILASVKQLGEAIATLGNHGVAVHRVVMTVGDDQLSPGAKEQLRRAVEAHGVEIQHLREILPLPSPRRGYIEPGALPRTGRIYAVLRRSGDILAAGLALTLLSPVLLATALLVLIDVGAPVLFWQERPGRYGVPFRLYKFRTMAEPVDRSGRVIPEDRRTSAIGRFIRRWRLDEFPQLANVLFGSMSIVGPRPLLARDQPANAEQRLSVRPGITGWAQVHGGQAVSPEQKRALDLWYTENVSLVVDMKILFLTLRSLARGDRRSAMLAELALQDGAVLARPATPRAALEQAPARARAAKRPQTPAGGKTRAPPSERPEYRPPSLQT